MKPKEKNEKRIELTTRAVILCLEAYNKRNPGQCIVKSILFPYVIRRADWIIEDDNDPIYDEEAIAPPNINFLMDHWSEICLRAAEHHNIYIVWGEHYDGVRLGTLEEYQKTRNKLSDIANYLAESIIKRDHIIVKRGGKSYQIDIRIKRIGPGDFR